MHVLGFKCKCLSTAKQAEARLTQQSKAMCMTQLCDLPGPHQAQSTFSYKKQQHMNCKTSKHIKGEFQLQQMLKAFFFCSVLDHLHKHDT